MTVNNIKNYKEYEPIKYLKTEKEFIDQFNKLFEESEKLEITEYIYPSSTYAHRCYFFR